MSLVSKLGSLGPTVSRRVREYGLAAMLSLPLIASCGGSGPSSNLSPSAQLTSYPSQVVVGSPVSVVGSASDADGSVDRVEFSLDGSLIVDHEAPWQALLTAPSTPGSYGLRMVSYDDDGASGVDEQSLEVIAVGENPAIGYWESIGGDARVDPSLLGADGSLTRTNVSYDGYEAAGVPADWIARLRRGYDAEFMDAVHARLMGRGMSVEKAQEWFDGFGADGAISYDNWLVAIRNIEEHEKAFDRGTLDPSLDQFLTPPNLPILTHWFTEDFSLPRTYDDGSFKEGTRIVSYMDWTGRGDGWFGFPQLAGLAPEGEQYGQDGNGFDFAAYWPVVRDEHEGVVQAFHSFPFPSFIEYALPLYFDYFDNYDHQVGLQSRRGVDFSPDTVNVSELRWEATHGNGNTPDGDGYFRPDGLPVAPGEFLMPSNASDSGSLGQWLFNVSTINVDPRDPEEGLVNYDVIVEAPSSEWTGAVTSMLRSGYDMIDVFWEYPDSDHNLMLIDYRVNRPVFNGDEHVGWDYSGHLPLSQTPR